MEVLSTKIILGVRLRTVDYNANIKSYFVSAKEAGAKTTAAVVSMIQDVKEIYSITDNKIIGIASDRPNANKPVADILRTEWFPCGIHWLSTDVVGNLKPTKTYIRKYMTKDLGYQIKAKTAIGNFLDGFTKMNMKRDVARDEIELEENYASGEEDERAELIERTLVRGLVENSQDESLNKYDRPILTNSNMRIEFLASKIKRTDEFRDLKIQKMKNSVATLEAKLSFDHLLKKSKSLSTYLKYGKFKTRLETDSKCWAEEGKNRTRNSIQEMKNSIAVLTNTIKFDTDRKQATIDPASKTEIQEYIDRNLQAVINFKERMPALEEELKEFAVIRIKIYGTTRFAGWSMTFAALMHNKSPIQMYMAEAGWDPKFKISELEFSFMQD